MITFMHPGETIRDAFIIIFLLVLAYIICDGDPEVCFEPRFLRNSPPKMVT